MTALATERLTKFVGDGHGPLYLDAGIDGGSKIYEGAMVALLTATGMAVPAGTAASGPAIGVSKATYDNVSGSDGDKSGRFSCGQFWFVNNGTSIAAKDRFLPCYIVDDQTVDLSSSNSTRQAAGLIIDVDSTLGVKVWISPEAGAIAAASADATATPVVQAGTGALTSGVLTVATGITVTANSRVVVTLKTPAGTFSDGGFDVPAADRVVGVPGVGTIVIRALVQAGTANVNDTSTVDYVIVG